MQKRRELLIAVFLLSLGAIVWPVFFKSEPLSLKDYLGLVPTVMSFVGILRQKKTQQKGKKVKPFRLTPSFDSGLYGGLIGGAFAGLIIGVAYYLDASAADASVGPLSIIPEVFAYACLIGAVTGAFSQLGMLLFCWGAAEKGYPTILFNEVTGGALGGALGGILLGALGGWAFGLRTTVGIDANVLVGGAAFGGVCAALGALLYDYKESARKFMRAIVILLAITILLGLFTALIFQSLGITASWFEKWNTPGDATEAGAIVGALVGIMLGLQIGLTLRLYRSLEIRTER